MADNCQENCFEESNKCPNDQINCKLNNPSSSFSCESNGLEINAENQNNVKLQKENKANLEFVQKENSEVDLKAITNACSEIQEKNDANPSKMFVRSIFEIDREYFDENNQILIKVLSKESKDKILELIEKNIQSMLNLFSENLEICEKECRELKFGKSLCEEQIRGLEKDLAQSKADAFSWERKLKKVSEEKVVIQTDLQSRLERALNQIASIYKEKEEMVIKYAMGEKDILLVKKRLEKCEKNLKECAKDREILRAKVRNLTDDKSRISSRLDAKIQELGVAVRSQNKLKEDLNSKDIKLKWAHTRIQSEINAHKESQEKLDRALAKILNHDQELKSTVETAEKIVKESKEGENNRACLLEKELKETKASLTEESKKYQEINKLYEHVNAEYENLRASTILSTTELSTLRAKILEHETERNESENLFKSLQNELKILKDENMTFSKRLKDLQQIEEKLKNSEQNCDSLEKQVLKLEENLKDEKNAASSCREKEAELLLFTQKLSDKNIDLNRVISDYDNRIKDIELDNREKCDKYEDVSSKYLNCLKEYEILERINKIEIEKLNSEILEKNKIILDLETKISDLNSEVKINQKRYTNSLKDTNREVVKLRKKLDVLEAANKENPVQSDGRAADEVQFRGGIPTLNYDRDHASEARSLNNFSQSSCRFVAEGMSQSSRTSSNTSLNNLDLVANSVNSHGVSRHSSPLSSVADLPQNVLLERIGKLQSETHKKREKIEFLEDNCEQLLSELKKKKKIIQHYVLNTDFGALVGSKSDQIKAEMQKHGTIMSSVYASSAKDATMTLDLSLEINQKLQALLEDTLLKNITLKDNLNTLGEEVAVLTMNKKKP